MLWCMPRELDQRRLDTLRRIFASTASDVPEFVKTAVDGGYRSDTGVIALVPGEGTLYAKCDRLKQAVVESLDAGNAPNRRDESGDREMQFDSAVFYEFRIAVDGVRLFVKTVFDEDDPSDPEVRVLSVKRDDRSWS